MPSFARLQNPHVWIACCAFNILIRKCAWHRSCVHFLSKATSKSAPNMLCLFFLYFDLEICFVPQLRAIFQQSNFQNCPIIEVLLTVWLPHRLPAISASAFATAQLPKVSEAEAFLTVWFGNVLRATAACIFWSLIPPDGSAPTLGSLLFDPPEPQNIGRTVSRYFSTFPCAWPSFYLLSLLWLFPSLLLHLSTSRKKHIIWYHMVCANSSPWSL